jgi:hypothetical protein
MYDEPIYDDPDPPDPEEEAFQVAQQEDRDAFRALSHQVGFAMDGITVLSGGQPPSDDIGF